jgi:protein-disulfide isomerase
VPGWLRITTVVAACGGLFVAAVLAAGHILDLPVPCGGSRGCVVVASHPSSRLFGVPIAYIGMAAYLAQLVLLGRPIVGRRARFASLALAAAGTLMSAGLLIYAQTVIRATCPWCIASGLAMLVLFISGIFWLRPRGAIRGVRPVVMWSFGLVTAAAIGVQAGRMEKAASLPPIPAHQLADVSLEDLLDPPKTVGPADAAVTIVIFGDLLCPACRAAVTSLLSYQREHPVDIRVVYRHQPLWEIRGHETSRVAAVLSEMAGEQRRFWAFAEAVHGSRGQMNREQYLQLMRQLGFEPVTVETRLADLADRSIVNVQRDIALAEKLGIHATPTFVLKVGSYPLVSASQRGLSRLLNSAEVTSILAARAASPARAK